MSDQIATCLRRCISYLLLFRLFATPLWAQISLSELNTLQQLFEAGEFGKAMPMAHALRARCAASADCNGQMQGELNLMFARLQLQMGRPDSCLYFTTQSLATLNMEDCAQRASIAANRLLRSQSMAAMGDLDGCEKELLGVIDAHGDDPKMLANTLVNLGNVSILQENYAQGRSYLLQAVDLMRAAYGPQHTMVAYCYHNLAVIAEENGDWHEGEDFLRKALAIKETALGPDHPQLISTLTNLAINLYNQDLPAEAIAVAQRAELISIAALGPENPKLLPTLLSLATFSVDNRQPREAQIYLDRCLALIATLPDPSHPDVARTHLQAAETYVDLGMLDLAKQQFQRAAGPIGFDARHPLDWRHVRFWEDFSDFLACQQKYYAARAVHEPHFRDSVAQALHWRLALYETRMLEPRWTQDRTFATAKAHTLYEEALNFLYDRDSIDLIGPMFELMERSKARMLRESVMMAEGSSIGGVPDSVRATEAALEEQIYALEEEQQALSTDAPERHDVDARLHGMRMQRLRWIEGLAAQYPLYYQWRYQQKVVGLRSLQAQLPPGITVVSYFEGEEALFIAGVTRDTAHVVRIHTDGVIAQEIRLLRAGIAGYALRAEVDPRKYQAECAKYCAAAYNLYRMLLGPIEQLLTERLVIVPDGTLHGLPFDALLTAQVANPTAFGAHPYLIRKHVIHTEPSATLMVQRGKAEHVADPLRTLAMAPLFAGQRLPNGDRTALAPLLHNIAEAQAVQSIWKGDLLTGKAASCASFKAMAGQYGILHLATHAQSDDAKGEFSSIAFAGTADADTHLLRAHDLYTMHLQADLVVLSACETGWGELRRGEGMISLSRGFMYAGARATVASLWAVDDLNSQELMRAFHQGLKNGLPKDEALREAKLNFLRENADPHPYYWAGMVPSGDMDALDGNGNRWIWPLLLGLFVAGILYWWMRDDAV